MILQYKPSFGIEEINAISEYIASGGWGTEFKITEAFEKEIAEFLNVKYCCMTANGTVSIAAMLMAAGIGPGHNVLVPAFTMIATANAVMLTGAQVSFMDVSENVCSDVCDIEKKLDDYISAVIVVDINGRSPDYKPIEELCKRKNVLLFEDAAQALGSADKYGRNLGTIGLAGSFSFSSAKIISTGQGGCVVTNDKGIDAKIRKIKDFGRISPGVDTHTQLGYNFKYNDFLASIGREQLKKLPERIKLKKDLAKYYRENLKDIQVYEACENEVLWFFDILTNDREKLSASLKNSGILTRNFYPPIHQQNPYCSHDFFKMAETFSKSGIWLPSGPDINVEEVDFVCKSINKFLETNLQ